MKNCKSCGRSLSDDALFCSGCGGSDFVVGQAEDASQDRQFNFTPTEIKGKVKAWQIIVIALGCIALIAAGIFAVKNVLSAKSYTSGEIVENVYTNDWAELKYVIGDDFKDLTAEEGAYYQDDDYEVGFFAMRESDGATVTVSFQYLGNTRGYSEREGMDDYLLGYDEEIKNEVGITPTISQYFDYSIAENDYTTAKIEVIGVGAEYHCIRFQGEYAIIITAFATSEEDVQTLLSSFEQYEAE